jgi:hypothetical protein
MKPDPHRPTCCTPQDVADLPPKRKWFGYAAVAASLAITYALWLAAMGAADEWYDNPWNYPAKVGSHGTLILMCWAFILATRFRWVERLFGGLDKVYKAHRHIGESAFFLIFLHPVFLAVAHADSVSAFFRYLVVLGKLGAQHRPDRAGDFHPAGRALDLCEDRLPPMEAVA